MSNINPVGWYEIYVSDMNRARKFYNQVFGFELTDAPPMPGSDDMEMVFFPMAPEGAINASGALVKMNGFTPGGGGTIVYFSCKDCSAEAERAETVGGKILQPKTSIGEWGFISLISDSEGNTIGLHSQQ